MTGTATATPTATTTPGSSNACEESLTDKLLAIDGNLGSLKNEGRKTIKTYNAGSKCKDLTTAQQKSFLNELNKLYTTGWTLTWTNLFQSDASACASQSSLACASVSTQSTLNQINDVARTMYQLNLKYLNASCAKKSASANKSYKGKRTNSVKNLDSLYSTTTSSVQAYPASVTQCTISKPAA